VTDRRELSTVSLKPFDFDRLFASGAGCTGPDGQCLTVQVDEGWLALPRSFVGLRTDLTKVSEERVQELIEHAWRNKAPKRVVAAYDAP
jgi:hypothetical protein